MPFSEGKWGQPLIFLFKWLMSYGQKEICNFSISGEAEMGSAGVQPGRNILMTEDGRGEVNKPASPYFKNQSSLVLMQIA